MVTPRDAWDWDWVAWGGGILAAGATAAAAWFARAAAKANKNAVEQMKVDHEAETNRKRAAELRRMHEIIGDLEKLPLIGDLTGINRGVEELRRLKALSVTNAPKVDEVLAAYERWGATEEAGLDPRTQIPSALAELEAMVRSLEG